MKTNDLNINLIDAYFGLLKNLSADSKLELIAKLSNSMKTTKKTKDESLKSLYGAFVSNQSADEIIKDIKQSRTFNRKRAAL
ncbi:MAG: hypothetical protein ABI723_09785 [Bacteroidia bacterium]